MSVWRNHSSAEGKGTNEICYRNPFNDDLIASGSDDGRVRDPTHNR